MRSPLNLALRPNTQCIGKRLSLAWKAFQHQLRKVARPLSAKVTQNLPKWHDGAGGREKPLKGSDEHLGRKGLGDHVIHTCRPAGSDFIWLDMG
jgi:hypothetical protein